MLGTRKTHWRCSKKGFRPFFLGERARHFSQQPASPLFALVHMRLTKQQRPIPTVGSGACGWLRPDTAPASHLRACGRIATRWRPAPPVDGNVPGLVAVSRAGRCSAPAMPGARKSLEPRRPVAVRAQRQAMACPRLATLRAPPDSSSSAIASCARSNGATRFPRPFISPTRSPHRERGGRKGSLFGAYLLGLGIKRAPPPLPGRIGRGGWPEWQQTLPDKGFNGALTSCPPVHRSGVVTCLW
jgi:hypothetical protein